jgi:HAE1 family hydrophobic/amphiphilic exporter-1
VEVDRERAKALRVRLEEIFGALSIFLGSQYVNDFDFSNRSKLLGVPVAVLGALAGQLVRGLENDVFCQVGLLMLVGLASKNAILIVEFANQLREGVRSIVEAAREAAETRLRPILMTSLAFILGIFPLVIATGAGQAARHSLGTAVLSGMVVSTIVNLYLIPVLYVGFETLSRARPIQGDCRGDQRARRRR